MKIFNKRGFSILLMSSFVLGSIALGSGYYAYEHLLDFDLYKNERWQGSREAEKHAFLRAVGKVAQAQLKLFYENGSQTGKPQRLFHAKQLGCLTGKLNILDKRKGAGAEDTFEGIFDPKSTGKESYDVLVRFSNGVGIVQHDKKPDVRGMAIKVLGVRNSETGQEQSIDFAMTNAPIPAGRDFNEFVEFMDLVIAHGPAVGTSIFVVSHPKAGKGVLATTGLSNYKLKSMATTQFWSGHPYLLGKDKAMKLNARPLESKVHADSLLRSWGEDYLNVDLEKRLERARAGGAPLKFAIQVQLEVSPEKTPVEDALNEWTERESPSIQVAELVFDAQSVDPERTPLKSTACEELRFTPGNYVPEHRPLSNIARGRIFAYRASQLGRGARAGELSSEEFETIRNEGMNVK